MTIARAHLIDPSVTRWYHCITRCVRRAFLLGEGESDREVWIDHRLRELAEIFSISVAGFSVMDNHLHVLARLDPQVAAGWSDEEVVRRWGRLFPHVARFQRLGRGSPRAPRLGRDGARAPAKPQLVHEVPQGTTLTDG